ncbi:MAG: HmuY family protein [Tannerella sp.]|jgi:hypothetical protein|nr:HmuY family protein [Tannerella sp.]
MKTTLKLLPAILAALAALAACDIHHLWDKDYMFEIETPHDGLFVHDCSSYTDWHFFSFDAAGIIGRIDAADSAACEAWRLRTDWDLAFHRQNVKTNSGASGAGQGGIMKYPQQTFSFDAVTEAPEEGYLTDAPDSVIYDMSRMAAGEIGYVAAGLAQPVKDWAVLTDMMNGVWTYAQSVFIVRTATGKYARIWLKNFKSDIGASGTVTMQYVYQSDGTLNLHISPDAPSKSPAL